VLTASVVLVCSVSCPLPSVARNHAPLGLAIVKAIGALDNTIVFAGVRNVQSSTALQELASTSNNKIHVLRVVSADLENNKAAVEEIKRVAGRLDVVIANAGIGFGFKSCLDTPLQDMQDHFTVNVVGTLALFQAAYPLLKASTSTPKFVPISSFMGSIEKGPPFPSFQMPYGVSKAALNWLTAKLRNEHEGLSESAQCQHCQRLLIVLLTVAFPLCPGSVATDLADDVLVGDPVVKKMMDERGLKLFPADAVAPNIVKLVNEGTRETNVFLSQDGSTIPW
jgi:NAD(P)-dependent dehydrogenase (short-subunit alcohol dehydrogenase family)